jgi:uncharacterized membrane protein
LRSGHVRILVGLTLAAGAIRFLTLGVQNFDHDEAVTAIRVLQPNLGDTLAIIPGSERTPPLYYLLAWVWSKPFGLSEVGLRSLSALFGMLTVPVVFAIGARLASKRAGLIAAALVAFNPFLIWFSQDARAYALLILLSSLSLLFFVRAWQDEERRDYAAWAGFSALALATHYFAVFPIAVEAAALLVVAVRRRVEAIAAVAATAVVGLALLPLAIHQRGGTHVDPFTSASIARRAVQVGVSFAAGLQPSFGGGGSNSHNVQILATVVLVGALPLAAIALVRQLPAASSRDAIVVFLVGAIGVALPLALALGGIDYFTPHNVAACLVPLLVAAGVGLAIYAPLWRALAVGVTCASFAFLVLLMNTNSHFQRENWAEVSAAIGEFGTPRLIVVSTHADDTVLYYRRQDGIRPFVSEPAYASHLGARQRPVRGVALVREVDVMVPMHGGAESLPPGFKLVASEKVGIRTVRRFRAPRLVAIRLGGLRDELELRKPARVLVEAASVRPERGDGDELRPTPSKS